MKVSLFLIGSLVNGVTAQAPVVALSNAAAPGQTMPWTGLGTGGYGTSKGAYGGYPECWMEIAGCGNYTIEAVKTYLALGSTGSTLRLDAADRCDLFIRNGLPTPAAPLFFPVKLLRVLLGRIGSQPWTHLGFFPPCILTPSPFLNPFHAAMTLSIPWAWQ